MGCRGVREAKQAVSNLRSNLRTAAVWLDYIQARSHVKGLTLKQNSSIPLARSWKLFKRPRDNAALLKIYFYSKLTHEFSILYVCTNKDFLLKRIAFSTNEFERLLKNLDSPDSLSRFSLFFKETSATVPIISVVFRCLVPAWCFPKCWRVANSTPIPEGSLSPDAANYRPASVTTILSKAFEHLVSARLSRFPENFYLLSDK